MRPAPRLGFILSLVTLAACSAATQQSTSSKGGSGGSSTGGGGSGGAIVGGAGGQGGAGGDINIGGLGGTGGAQIPCEPGESDVDNDLDGFTEDQGDCNDCDVNVNPNAVEVIDPNPAATPVDENCDGTIDEPPPPPCDDALELDTMDAADAAKAVGLCKLSADAEDWGLVSAKWTMADGSAPPASPNFHLGHGMLDAFGPNVDVREGAKLLALSSGTARQPSDPGYQNVSGFSKGYQGAHPQGFPKESPSCPGTITGQPNDVTGVELTVRAPANAYGFSFDFNFYTYEWPGFVCSSYNDFFVALLEPIPMGQLDGNISFDSQGNPVSVNNAFLEVCGCEGNPPNPCFAGGKQFTCALGNVELIGTGFGFDSTGFEDHAATSWLRTTAPVAPGSEFDIRWAVYDSGDGVLDSTTLIDRFQWVATPGTVVSTEPPPN
jgi:hypothetical protein